MPGYLQPFLSQQDTGSRKAKRGIQFRNVEWNESTAPLLGSVNTAFIHRSFQNEIGDPRNEAFILFLRQIRRIPKQEFSYIFHKNILKTQLNLQKYELKHAHCRTFQHRHSQPGNTIIFSFFACSVLWLRCALWILILLHKRCDKNGISVCRNTFRSLKYS